MIIVTQDNELINMDNISYISIKLVSCSNPPNYTDKLIDKFKVIAEDSNNFYLIGTYDTIGKAHKCVNLIRQGIEEDWRVCGVC